MPTEPEVIACPKYPDHGPVAKRWLPPAEREMITSDKYPDVYEIDCPHCGKYEYQNEFDSYGTVQS